jgi:soluble lytic murein transglycosylase-like protein
MLTFFMFAKIVTAMTLVLSLSPVVRADIYKYTDENGVICFTDAPFGKKTERVAKEKTTDLPTENRAVTRTSANRPAASTFAGPVDYAPYVRKAASKYEVEPELIRAVIKAESNGDHRAVSPKGAKGLMQLMPQTANDMNVSNPFNPEENIEGGTRYLRYLLEKFNGDITLAVAAYNAGPQAVEKYGNVPPISETIQYVKKVFAFYRGKHNITLRDGREQATKNFRVPTVVYKIVLEDGTVLFTNSSLAKTGKVRF